MNSEGGKRAVDRATHHEGNKSRRLSGAVLAELQEDMLCRRETTNQLESWIRKVVAEEIDNSLSNFATPSRAPQWQITGSSSTRKFRLHFISNPIATTFTDTKFEDTIYVRLVDVTTGQLVSEGPESVAELDVVPLVGDFNTPDEEDWTADEFERNVAKERDGKAPLLAGKLKVYLKGGLGTLGEMYFTDNSSWTRSGKFRLGIAVARDNDGGLAASIREGKSQAFAVKDSRGKGYMKHDEPKPNDEVWRLRHIRRGGPIHQTLAQHDIHTVQDFLLWIWQRPGDLKEVLSSMPAKAYKDAVQHATRCVLGDKMFLYPVNQSPYEDLIFNQNYQTVGAVAQGHFVGLDRLNDTEKVQMDALVKSAYNNWGTNVSECMVGDPATAEEPLVDMGSQIPDVEPTSSHIQARDDDLIDNAMVAEQQHNSLGMITTSTLHCDDSEMIIASLWNYDDSGIGITEELSAHNIERQVKEVLWEEYADADYGDPRECAPTPPTSRWWLRIRAVVRCALFIRKAGFLQQQRRPLYDAV